MAVSTRYSYTRMRKRRVAGGYGAAAFGAKPPAAYTPTLPDVPAAPSTPLVADVFTNPAAGGGGHPPPGTMPPTTTPPSATFDPNTDPIVASVLAQNERDRQAAHAAMLAAQEQLLLGFGDPDLARKILGAQDPILGGISSDYTKGATSTMARLKKNYADTVSSNEDQLNKANLFFSGARVKRLSDLSYQNQARVGDATTVLNQAIQAQVDKFNAEKQAEADRYLSALDSAYTRWLQSQLNNPGGGGDTTGGDKTPPGDKNPPPGAPPPKKGKTRKKPPYDRRHTA